MANVANQFNSKQVFLYLSLSPEAQRLLADNEVDLFQQIRREGLAVQRTEPPETGPVLIAGSKAVELVILVSAVAAPLVASAVSRIIDAIGRNQRAVVTNKIWTSVLGPDGKPILDASGKPVMEWKETHQLLEPQQTTQEQLASKISFLGLDVRLSGDAAASALKSRG